MKSIKERIKELDNTMSPKNSVITPEALHLLMAENSYYKELHESASKGQFNIVAHNAHTNALCKGFYNDGKGRNIAEKLMLITCEVSEACEADRKDNYLVNISDADRTKLELLLSDENYKGFSATFERVVKNTFEDEIADVIIRCLELSGWKNIDIDWHVRMKMRYNSTREKMHGKKY